MKKKALVLILGAAMVMSLASCGTYTDSGSSSASSDGKDSASSDGKDSASSDAGDSASGTESTVSDSASEAESTESDSAASTNESLTFVSTEPNTLNLIQSQSNLDSDVFYLISAMLYRPYDGDVYPELSDGYTVSDDGLTYTYTIKDAVYSDGTAITAADFAYYMVQSLPYAEDAIFYKNGEAFVNGECEASEVGIYATDDHTLVVELAAQFADFDPELQVYPLNQAFAEEQGENLGGTPENLQYSGPYVLTDWTYGSSMSFVKNDSYIDAETSFPIQNLKMISSTDSSGRYAIFSSGEADILISVSEEVKDQIGEQYCTHYDSNAVQGLEFNYTGYYYDGTTFAERDAEVTALIGNENFRKALSYAIDRNSVVAVVNPTGQAYNRYMLNTVEGSTEGSLFTEEYPLESAAPMDGDADAAKEYLAQALSELGYSDVSELPTVKYLTFDSDMYRLMAETLQSQWKTVLGLENIEIELQPVSDAVMSMVFMDYDIYWTSLSADALIPCLNLGYWKTGGGVSDAMQSGAPFASIYSNADFDELVEAATYEQDAKTRCDELAQAEDIFIDSCTFVPVQLNGGYYAVSDAVSGFTYSGTQYGLMFNQTTISK